MTAALPRAWGLLLLVATAACDDHVVFVPISGVSMDAPTSRLHPGEVATVTLHLTDSRGERVDGRRCVSVQLNGPGHFISPQSIEAGSVADAGLVHDSSSGTGKRVDVILTGAGRDVFVVADGLGTVQVFAFARIDEACTSAFTANANVSITFASPFDP